MTRRGGPRKKQSASSTSENGVSGKARAASDALVLDFLYYDAARVGSFLAQVDAGGHLTGVTQGESVSKGKRRGHTVKLGGQLPAIPGFTHEGVEGTVSYELGPGDTGTETGQRTYDPFWTNARNFLDFLTDENLIQADLSKAGMGQFTIQAGSLWLLDMKSVQGIIENPLMQSLITALPVVANNPLAPLLISLVPRLDLGVQFTMISDGEKLWGTLRPDALSVSMGDLILKHGAQISGTWTLLGILDARPDAGEIAAASPFEGLAQAAVGFGALRPQIGRPPQAFGVTPLLIYREIAGE